MSDAASIPLAPRPGNVFSGSPLDRQALLRKDEAWIEARLGEASSLFVPYWRDHHLVLDGGDPRAVFLTRDAIDGLLDEKAEIAFLGVPEGLAKDVAPAHFAVDLSHLDEAALLGCAPGPRR